MQGMYFTSLHSYRIHFNTKTMILLSIPSILLEWYTTVGSVKCQFPSRIKFNDTHDAINIKSVARQSSAHVGLYTVFDQTPRLLFLLRHVLMWLLFKGGYYSRGATI